MRMHRQPQQLGLDATLSLWQVIDTFHPLNSSHRVFTQLGCASVTPCIYHATDLLPQREIRQTAHADLWLQAQQLLQRSRLAALTCRRRRRFRW